ncbi:MAG: septum formation protein Maf [Myxococcales bacterium]|nr:septum formation protein Maf [Myxococcales bacterium]
MTAAPSPRLDPACPLVLASGSPRRREVLETLRIPHVVVPVDVDESTRGAEPPAAYLERIVTAKLEAGARAGGPERAASLVLVADTSVLVDGAILGKPTSTEHAEEMISRLAGRSHEVCTRFALGVRATGGASTCLHAETVRTVVHVRPLDAAQVRAYVATGEGTDKAGAYAVQGIGAGIVSRIEGSYTNVVGLPACELVVALEGLGIQGIR